MKSFALRPVGAVDAVLSIILPAVCLSPGNHSSGLALSRNRSSAASRRLPGPQPWEPDLTNQPSHGDVVVVVAVGLSDDMYWVNLQPHDYALMTKGRPEGGIHNLPINAGREAASYLQFILLHWDHLPERMIFMHGHWASWHAWVRTARACNYHAMRLVCWASVMKQRCWAAAVVAAPRLGVANLQPIRSRLRWAEQERDRFPCRGRAIHQSTPQVAEYH